ncbi:MAG: c-type cytochrome [Acidobacteria bacterium]|nr:c-type cytochrome [Acidobacteriota bacterium]
MKICVLFAACVIVAFSACSGSTATNTGPANTTVTVVTPDPNAAPPPETMAAGKKLYASNCAVCHRETGTGGKVEVLGKKLNPDDLTSHKIRAMADDKIYGYIYKGIEDEGMPSFKDKLAEAEIREIVRYVRVELQKIPEADLFKTTPK